MKTVGVAIWYRKTSPKSDGKNKIINDRMMTRRPSGLPVSTEKQVPKLEKDK